MDVKSWSLMIKGGQGFSKIVFGRHGSPWLEGLVRAGQSTSEGLKKRLPSEASYRTSI